MSVSLLCSIMYDVIQTKRPSGQNVDNLNLVRHTISFQKIIVSKIPRDGGRGVFPRPFTHGGISAGGQSIKGGTHEGDINLMGGPNFDRLYHKLKVLLLLSCNYTMQFVGYDSIKTH